MAGKKKGKKVRKQEKKIIDEYQLRRDLREQAKMTKELVQEVNLVQEIAMPIQDEPRYSEDIRIGGIEG